MPGRSAACLIGRLMTPRSRRREEHECRCPHVRRGPTGSSTCRCGGRWGFSPPTPCMHTTCTALCTGLPPHSSAHKPFTQAQRPPARARGSALNKQALTNGMRLLVPLLIASGVLAALAGYAKLYVDQQGAQLRSLASVHQSQVRMPPDAALAARGVASARTDVRDIVAATCMRPLPRSTGRQCCLTRGRGKHCLRLSVTPPCGPVRSDTMAGSHNTAGWARRPLRA